MFYSVYTSDIVTTKNTLLSTDADDLAILALYRDDNLAIDQIQLHLNLVAFWASK